MNNDIMEEIFSHTKLGWRKFGQLNIVFKSNIPFCLKKQPFDQYILAVLTYGSETWTLNSKSIQKTKYHTTNHRETNVKYYTI